MPFCIGQVTIAVNQLGMKLTILKNFRNLVDLIVFKNFEFVFLTHLRNRINLVFVHSHKFMEKLLRFVPSGEK